MRILFIKISDSTFIRKDEEILRRHFKLDSIRFRYPNRFLLPIKLIQLFLWLVLHGRKYDVIFYYFIDFHSLPITVFGKLFGVKTAVVIGGYDAVHIPELGYGVYNNPIRGAIARLSLKHTDLLLPKDDSLIHKKETFTNKLTLIQGFKNFVGSVKGKVKVVYNGYSSPHLSENDIRKKENTILSVGFAPTKRDFLIKGHDLFVKTAGIMPGYRFVLVGVRRKLVESLIKDIPENLEITGPVSQEKVSRYMKRAKIYCQLSLAEGMPNALCEAMLHGCIPVGSSAGGIPNVIGDTGAIVKKKDARLVRDAILQAMKLDPHKPIERIRNRFPLERRERELKEAIEELAGG